MPGSLADALRDVAMTSPDALAVVDGYDLLTCAEQDGRVRRAVASLAQRGVTAGDVVAWQLPNWWEAVVRHHAIVALGAVSNPLIPILREREMTFMLR